MSSYLLDSTLGRSVGRGRKLTRLEAKVITAEYDGGIRYLDQELEDLFSYLRQIGRFDNTLLIVSADHGDTLGENGHWGHGVDTCQREVHIPLLVKYPRQTLPKVVTSLVSEVDLLPTVIDVVSRDVPTDVDGVSLLRLGDTGDRVILSSSLRRKGRRPFFERALFSGDYKLVSTPDAHYRLYNLANDPYQQNNLYSKNSPVAGDLTASLEHWLASTSFFIPERVSVSPLDTERLKALGYVQ